MCSLSSHVFDEHVFIARVVCKTFPPLARGCRRAGSSKTDADGKCGATTQSSGRSSLPRARERNIMEIINTIIGLGAR